MATLVHQVLIDAEPSRVYEGLCNAEGLSKWWAPHASALTDDGVVLSHTPGEAHGDVRMLVKENTQERIEWLVTSSHPSESPASSWTGTTIVFEITERPSPGHWMGMEGEDGSVTVLDFRHGGWDENSPFFGFCNYAWGVTLDLLRQWCESETETDEAS